FLGSAGALALGEDYLDPFRVSGGTFHMERLLSDGGRIRLELGVEQHASEDLKVETAPLAGGRAFRPVLPVDDGILTRGRIDWRRPLDRFPGGTRGELS